MPTLATLIEILSTSLWAYFKSFGCFFEKNRKQVFSGHCLDYYGTLWFQSFLNRRLKKSYLWTSYKVVRAYFSESLALVSHAEDAFGFKNY